VHPETFLRIGRIHYLQGDLAKAEEAFLESVHRWYWDAAGHKALAYVYYQTGRTKDAVRELGDALRVEPGDRDVADALAEIEAGRPLKTK
jgi:Flp pilus assembly protein TadD